MSSHKVNFGHPVDRDLSALELVQRGIEAQLEFERLLIERNNREIELAKRLPDGKLILQGRMRGQFKTLDPEVYRSWLVQDGWVKGIVYVNPVRKIFVAIDWQY